MPVADIVNFSVTVGDPPPAPADFVITSDAEWVSTFSQSTESLDGKVIEVQGTEYTGRTLTNHSFTTGIVLRGAPGSRIPSLAMAGPLRNVQIQSMNFQMTGWPYTKQKIVDFTSGAFSGIRIWDCTFRHGSGASLGNFDVANVGTMSEVQTTDNIGSAATTASVVNINWADNTQTAPGGWIVFINTGSDTVYVRVDDSGVIDTVTDIAVPAGDSKRFTGISPLNTPQITVMSASGTQSFNARSEFGMVNFLADAFGSAGGLTWETGIDMRRCVFTDLNNAAKGASFDLIMDCDFDRIYQDVMASGRIKLRNIFSVPFAVASHAQNPHGDLMQLFGSGISTFVGVVSAGNRTRATVGTENAGAQDIFYSDNDINPSYERCFSINDHLAGGAVRGIQMGEFATNSPSKDCGVYGATVLHSQNPTTVSNRIFIESTPHYSAVIDTVASGVEVGPMTQNVLSLASENDPASFLPNHSGVMTARTRAEIENVWEISGHTGGATATRGVIDWITTDPDLVIKWNLIPSFAIFPVLRDQPANTAVVSAPAKILNPTSNQSVIPGAGVEWRSFTVDANDIEVAETQAWTTASGTVQPLEMVQTRQTSSATAGAEVNFTININGHDSGIRVITDEISWHTDGDIIFADPAPFDSTWNSFVIFGKLRPDAGTGTVRAFWGGSSSALVNLYGDRNGDNLSFSGERSDGTVHYGSGGFTASQFRMGQWNDVVLSGDYDTGEFKFYVNGELIRFTTVAPAVGEFPASARSFFFLTGNATGSFKGDVASLKLWKGVALGETYSLPLGIPDKEISNLATEANADAWKVGTSTAVQN